MKAGSTVSAFLAVGLLSVYEPTANHKTIDRDGYHSLQDPTDFGHTKKRGPLQRRPALHVQSDSRTFSRSTPLWLAMLLRIAFSVPTR